MTARTLAAALLIAALGTALAQPQPTEPGGPRNTPVSVQPKAEIKSDRPDLTKLLATRVTVDTFEGKFKDAVRAFAEKYSLPLVLTHAAEEGRVGGDDADTKRGDVIVKLEKRTDIKLETALTLLCDQVGVRFLVYPDHIKIVPLFFWLYETAVLQHGPSAFVQGEEDTPFLPSAEMQQTKPLTKRGVVSASFKNKPLSDVLDEIVESTGATVALSPLLPANVRQAPVTVRFANTPVDAAVRTLCEMTECGVIEDANVLLVTTRERATARAKEEAQKLKDRRPQPISGPHFGGLVVPPSDVNGELAKIKEQNEQLKKELEEIKKLLKK